MQFQLNNKIAIHLRQREIINALISFNNTYLNGIMNYVKTHPLNLILLYFYSLEKTFERDNGIIFINKLKNFVFEGLQIGHK